MSQVPPTPSLRESASEDRSPPSRGAQPGDGPAPPERGGAWALAAYGVAAAAVVADQLSKWWVLGPLALPQRGQIPVVSPLFDLTLVHNAGVSFGLLRASADIGRWLLVLFSLGVAAALAVWARRVARPLAALSVGLIIGGAVGNAIDRIRLGFVTDFLDFSGLHFPWVFNVADSCITVGVALLVLESLFPARVAVKKP